MNGPKVCSRGMSQRHTMCGNIRYKHYESNEKDTTDNSNKDTTEGSDVTETTTVTITDTTTDETLTTNVNEEPISTTSNPHQNSNGTYVHFTYKRAQVHSSVIKEIVGYVVRTYLCVSSDNNSNPSVKIMCAV